MKIDLSKLKLRFGRKKETPNPEPTEQPTPQSGEPEPTATSDPSDQSYRSDQSDRSDPEPETRNSKPETGPRERETQNSQLSTFNPQPKQRQPTGKVGKLPKDLRNQVNEWLDDCVTYKKICSNLEKLGYPGFVHQNIQRWKDNGYQNHLREEERREDLIRCLEANERLGTDSNPAEKVAKAAETLMAVRMYKLMDASHDQSDEDLMGDKSKPFFALCGTLIKVMAQHHRNARLKLDTDTRQQKAAINQAMVKAGFDPNVGPSKEQREAIIQTVENVLGVNLDPAEIDALLSGPPAPRARTSGTESVASAPNDPTPPSKSSDPSDLSCRSALAKEDPPPTSAISAFSALENPVTPPERLPSTPECTVRTDSQSHSEPAAPPEKTDNSPNEPESTVTTEPPALPPQPEAQPSLPPVIGSISGVGNLTPKADAWSTPHSENPKPETQNPCLPAIAPRVGGKQRAFPVSPLATTPPEPKQPYGTVPVLDCCGAVVEWLPQKGEGSNPTFQDPIGFNNRYRETICWVHPKDPYRDRNIPEPNPRKSPILNVSGMILGWVAGLPDALRPPSATSEPVNSRRLPRGIVAWIDERRDYFQ